LLGRFSETRNVASADSFLNEGSQMNVPRINVIGASPAGGELFEKSSRWTWPWSRVSRDEARKWRLERDTERGHSINIKQVVLAFAVEFVIIGLILANQSAIAASLPNATWLSIIMGTSMPIALAMAELARIPLAICVRTHPSWNIKLLAIAGVMAAVVVTSVNLSLIGWNTYDPRLEEVNQKRVELLRLQDQKNTLASQIAEADAAVHQKRNDRDSVYEQQNRLQLELNKQQNVVAGTNKNRTIFRENPAIPLLKKELEGLKSKAAAAEAALKQEEAQRATYNGRHQDLDQKLSLTETEEREAVNRSQLHSYAAMLFGKDPSQLTDGEVKTLERYLIWIPAIAAALSSTLIAMTAVRRRKRPKKPQPEAILPDEAANYLFGPFFAAMKQAANDLVVAAMDAHVKPASASETAKATLQ
jgi:hypothetical protein